MRLLQAIQVINHYADEKTKDCFRVLAKEPPLVYADKEVDIYTQWYSMKNGNRLMYQVVHSFVTLNFDVILELHTGDMEMQGVENSVRFKKLHKVTKEDLSDFVSDFFEKAEMYIYGN